MSLHLDITVYTVSMSSAGAGIIGMYPTVVTSNKYGDTTWLNPVHAGIFCSVSFKRHRIHPMSFASAILRQYLPGLNHWDYWFRSSISLVTRCADLMKILWKGWTKAPFFTNILGSFRWLLILIYYTILESCRLGSIKYTFPI